MLETEDSFLIQLAQWGSSSGFPEASNWIWSDQFIPDYTEFVKKYPPGSDGFMNASIICSWYETIGTLYKHGLLNEELLFDWITVKSMWDRIKGFALGVREQSGVPRMYENFEAMANAEK